MSDFATPDITASLYQIQAQKAKQMTTDTDASHVSDADKAKLKGKAKEFESFFVYQTLELMQPKLDEDSVMNGGVGEDMFRHNLNEQMAKSVTDAGGFGIADTVYKEMLKHQEQRNATLANAAATYGNTAAASAPSAQ